MKLDEVEDENSEDRKGRDDRAEEEEEDKKSLDVVEFLSKMSISAEDDETVERRRDETPMDSILGVAGAKRTFDNRLDLPAAPLIPLERSGVVLRSFSKPASSTKSSPRSIHLLHATSSNPSSPKRPSEEPLEENRASPKRLSLQFRPERIASTSTPFAGPRGARALTFERGEEEEEGRREKTDGRIDGFRSLDQSIIAHGFPSSFFYSPEGSEARSTGVAGAAGAAEAGGAAGARPKDRRSGSTGRSRPGSSSSSSCCSSPSTHPMQTRSAASREDCDDNNIHTVDGDRVRSMAKSSLYSLYEALSQESGYWTRSKCRDIHEELAESRSAFASASLSHHSSLAHFHSHPRAPFCCLPDTPSQVFLRRPVSSASLEKERRRETEQIRRAMVDRVFDYFAKLRSLPPSMWIGKRVGSGSLDVITELGLHEPSLVIDVMSLLDDADLKTFSLVSPTWKKAVEAHLPTRRRLQTYEDRLFALEIQTQENTPLMEAKSRRLARDSHGYLSNGSSFCFDASDSMAFTPDNRFALKPVQRRAESSPSKSGRREARLGSPRGAASPRGARLTSPLRRVQLANSPLPSSSPTPALARFGHRRLFASPNRIQGAVSDEARTGASALTAAPSGTTPTKSSTAPNQPSTRSTGHLGCPPFVRELRSQGSHAIDDKVINNDNNISITHNNNNNKKDFLPTPLLFSAASVDAALGLGGVANSQSPSASLLHRKSSSSLSSSAKIKNSKKSKEKLRRL